jgi:hypothetical protein
MQFKDFYCDICGCTEGKRINFNLLFFTTVSHWPNLHKYDNFICKRCGVVFVYPQMSEKRLVEFYNTIYRESPYSLHIEDKIIDTPIKIPGSGVSLQRFKTFYDTIKRNSDKIRDLVPREEDVFIDYGAYQGMFLYGVSSIWKSKCIAYDYNAKGIEFAKNHFGFTDSVVGKNIYNDVFGKRAKYITLIHAFEHLRYPTKFLRHIKSSVLDNNGFLYMEVPNIYGYNLGEPSHFYSFSKDSLRNCLQSCEFQILDLFTTGYPPPHTPWLGHSDKINIVCLCRPMPSNQVPNLKEYDANVISSNIKRSWQRLSLIAVRKQLAIVFEEFSRLLYYCIIICLEKIFPKIALSLIKISKRLFGKKAVKSFTGD